MKTRILSYCIVVLVLVVLVPSVFAEEEILILVENKVWKLYYTGENITSAHFDNNAAVIFETGNNAKLTVKAPQVYTIGGHLFVLRDGEEVAPEMKTDDCFYYVTFESEFPEKIELLFAHWPEATETMDNCESFAVAPLKQIQLGILPDDIQCYDDKVLVFKSSDDSPACVKPESVMKLIERKWAKPIPELFRDETGLEFDLKGPVTSENINQRLELTKEFLDNNEFEQAIILHSEINYVSKQVFVTIASEEFTEEHTAEYHEENLKNWIPFDTRIVVARGFTTPENEQQEHLTLYVSNQSFENSPVDITVMIDGKILVDGDFDVGNQHVYIDYNFMLTPGTHTIFAKSVTGEAELEEEFEIDEEKWAVLSYWYYPDDSHFEFPHFDFVVYDTPVGFA